MSFDRANSGPVRAKSDIALSFFNHVVGKRCAFAIGEKGCCTAALSAKNAGYPGQIKMGTPHGLLIGLTPALNAAA